MEHLEKPWRAVAVLAEKCSRHQYGEPRRSEIRPRGRFFEVPYSFQSEENDRLSTVTTIEYYIFLVSSALPGER
jgi:hypothetical protein